MESDNHKGQLILYGYMWFVTNPICYIAYTSSIALAVFLTTERYLAICQHVSISLKKTKMISFSIILICAILVIPSWFAFETISQKFSSGTYTVGARTKFGREEFLTYAIGLRIFLFVIPLIIFLVFNILIIKKVRKSIVYSY